jgi:hypothetical protein
MGELRLRKTKPDGTEFTEVEIATQFLPDELRTALTGIFETGVTADTNQICSLWRGGKLIVEIGHQDLRDGGGDLVKARQVAARLLRVPARLCDQMALFYESFPTQEEFQRITSLRSKRGRPLSWGHLVILIQFRPKQCAVQRQKVDYWIKQTLDHDWTPRQLKNQIDKPRRQQQRQEIREQPRRVPGPTFEAKYFKVREQSASMCDLFVKAHVSKDFGILATLLEMPASEIRQQRNSIIGKLYEVEDLMENLARLAGVMAKDCEAGRKHVADICAAAPSPDKLPPAAPLPGKPEIQNADGSAEK